MNYTSQLFESLKTMKVYSSFRDNIWITDLADMKLTSE